MSLYLAIAVFCAVVVACALVAHRFDIRFKSERRLSSHSTPPPRPVAGWRGR